MWCTFFGHNSSFDCNQQEIKNAIIQLFENEGIKKFYVGNNGRFDHLVQIVLEELIKTYPEIEYYIVLSYLNECALSGNQYATIYPEGLEKSPPKYAISKRNLWMIGNSTYVIAYVIRRFSNSYRWIEKAKKRGLQIINIAHALI